VAVLRTYHPYNIGGLHSEGATKDGRAWGGTYLEGPLFEDLPPPQEIAHCVLNVWDNNDQEVEVILGPGGIVSGTRLSPGVSQFRLNRVCHALARARTDLLSGWWWNDQLRKDHRSLRRRWHYVAPCLAVGLLLASAWILRRRIASCGLSQARR
jgi:hypothetical protein